jgi:hypothetical protein
MTRDRTSQWDNCFFVYLTYGFIMEGYSPEYLRDSFVTALRSRYLSGDFIRNNKQVVFVFKLFSFFAMLKTPCTLLIFLRKSVSTAFYKKKRVSDPYRTATTFLPLLPSGPDGVQRELVV